MSRVHTWRKVIEVLNYSCLWDYITALRGPDASNCDTVKTMFTGFIRGKYTYGIGIKDTVVHAVDSYVESLAKELEFVGCHYVKHVLYGMKALRVYYEKVGNMVAASLIEDMEQCVIRILNGVEYGAVDRQDIRRYIELHNRFIEEVVEGE